MTNNFKVLIYLCFFPQRLVNDAKKEDIKVIVGNASEY